MTLDTALKVSAVEAKLDGKYVWARALLPYDTHEIKGKSKSILAFRKTGSKGLISFNLVWTTTLAPVTRMVNSNHQAMIDLQRGKIGREILNQLKKSAKWTDGWKPV